MRADPDASLRAACFSALDVLCAKNGPELGYTEALAQGFGLGPEAAETGFQRLGLRQLGADLLALRSQGIETHAILTHVPPRDLGSLGVLVHNWSPAAMP